MNLNLLKETLLARKKTFYLLVFLLVVNGLAFVYLSVYQEPRVVSLQSTWFDKRQQSSRTDTRDAATIYAQGMKDLQAWDSRILPQKDFARLIGELFETASNNSLAVTSITYKPGNAKEGGLLAYAVDLSVSGKYAGVKSFISDLMRSRQILVLENLSLANTSQTKEEVALKLKLVTYFRVEGQ